MDITFLVTGTFVGCSHLTYVFLNLPKIVDWAGSERGIQTNKNSENGRRFGTENCNEAPLVELP